MLRTRLPLTPLRIATKWNPHDLHALDTPPTFVLSQDQTLNRTSCSWLKHEINHSPASLREALAAGWTWFSSNDHSSIVQMAFWGQRNRACGVVLCCDGLLLFSRGRRVREFRRLVKRRPSNLSRAQVEQKWLKNRPVFWLNKACKALLTRPHFYAILRSHARVAFTRC